MQVPEHVQKGYDKAQAAVALRTANEAAVAPGKDADSELLAAYMAYTKLEEAQGDPARVQVPPGGPQPCRGACKCFWMHVDPTPLTCSTLA